MRLGSPGQPIPRLSLLVGAAEASGDGAHFGQDWAAKHQQRDRAYADYWRSWAAERVGKTRQWKQRMGAEEAAAKPPMWCVADADADTSSSLQKLDR